MQHHKGPKDYYPDEDYHGKPGCSNEPSMQLSITLTAPHSWLPVVSVVT
jgi:hypothetical protein